MTVFKVKTLAFLLINAIVAVKSEEEPSSKIADGANLNVSAGDATNPRNPVRISRVLDFYDADVLAEHLGELVGEVSKNCSENLNSYVDGLSSGEKWALKMDDASGRYTTGWFWGNRFWIGSQGLCDNIIPNGYKFNGQQSEQNHTRVARDTKSTETFSPSQSFGYKTGLLTYSSPAPFSVSFFVLKLELNTTLSDDTIVVQLGLCLPSSCTDADVKTVMEESTKKSEISVKVQSVKSPTGQFDIFQDTTFRTLCIVTGVITVFLIIGTSYDFFLLLEERKKRRKLSIKSMTYGDPDDKLSIGQVKLESNVDDKSARSYDLEHNNNAMEQKTEIMMTPKERSRDSLTVNIIKQIFLSFSLRRNINTICDRSVGSDTISTIHGLKAISMVWVILGHTCIIGFKYSDNMEYRKVVQKEFFFQTITNGAFSVDTFFFTSGLLVSFLYFRSNAKGKLDALGKKGLLAGCMHFLGLVGYRFARLSTPYLFVLGMVEVSMRWFSANSVFEPPTMDHENCPKYWWRNMLYINTLFPDSEMCMLWSWYLSDDTQFYVLGAVLLIVAASYFKTATVSLVIFMVSSWLTTAYISYDNEHSPSTNDPLALFDKIYDKPWTRLGPYLIGMCIGWLLFKTNCRIKITKLASIVGWLASTACLLSLVYGLYEADLSPLAGAAYSSLSHTAWALGLAWIVVACATRNGGFVNSILSWTILYPVSRITYCAYLLHPLVMRVMVMHMDSPLHLGKPLMITVFIGQVVLSYVFGFVVSAMYEAPVVAMLKILQTLPINKPKRIST